MAREREVDMLQVCTLQSRQRKPTRYFVFLSVRPWRQGDSREPRDPQPDGDAPRRMALYC